MCIISKLSMFSKLKENVWFCKNRDRLITKELLFSSTESDEEEDEKEDD